MNKIRYNKAYLFAVITVGLLIIVNLFIVQYWLGLKKQDAHIINMSGKQRMLSQQLASLVHYYQHLKTSSVKEELKQVFSDWERIHFILLNESDVEKLKIETSIQQQLALLTPKIAIAKSMIEQLDNFSHSEILAFQNNQNEFIEGMDKVVLAFQELADKKLQNIVFIQFSLSFLILLITLLQYQFIFKRRTKKIVLQYEELKEANIILEQYAYIASHDLRSPLQNIINFSSLLLEEAKGKLDEEEKTYLMFIEESTYRMQETIDALLHFSVISNNEIQKTPADANNLVEEVLRDISSIIAVSDAEVKIENLPSSITIDTSLFRQLMQNLLTNAIKFIPKGRKPEVVINCTPDSNGFLFQIEDNGIGIPLEATEKIFGIFKRLHKRRDYKGTGIGLAICKKVVEKHGGKIWLESEIGKGTTFYFNIPK